MRPLLHIYTTTWNNPEVMTNFIKWYRDRVPNCLITVYDNMSSDSTPEICKQLGCEVIFFNTEGTMDEKTLMSIRELGWLNPKHNSKVVLTCDDDELVDITPELLEDDSWNVIHCTGWEIFGKDGDTLEDFTEGLPSAGYSKKLVWKRDEIQSMNFGAGSHSANPVAKEGFEVKYYSGQVNCFHTKWAYGWEKGVARQKSIGPRVSIHSKSHHWNFHFNLPERLEEGQTGLNHWDYYSGGIQNRTKVR